MPKSRVIPKRLPVCPGRDSRFSIRRNDGVWWVHYKGVGGNWVAADTGHEELVSLVNELKEAEGNSPGGAFSINEHFQVIARMAAPSGYAQRAIHVVDISSGVVQKYTETITFDGGAIDPTASPAHGSLWPGPPCGSTFTFAAPQNPKPPSHNFDEVWMEVEGQVDLLSSHVKPESYPPKAGPLAIFLTELRNLLPSGGRFRVNEHGRAFTADKNLFIGNVPLESWFPAVSLTE